MSLTLYLRGGYYHYRGTIEGERFRGTTGTADKNEAKRFIIEKQSEILRQETDRKERGFGRLKFNRAAELYLQAGKTARFVQEMVDFWEDAPVNKITSGKVQQAAITLYPKAAGATRNRNVIVPTQAIINHAAALDMCHPIKVKRFKTETKVKEPATWEWVKQFMAHANPHLGAACCFMFLTGARVTEATNLTWADIDLRNLKALIKQTKVGKERQAHLPPELVAALTKIESNRDPAEKVFKYSSRHTMKPQWNKVFKRADIPYLTYHSCRHGFATTLLHRGVDPITVAKLGGWADAQLVFRTYGHAMRDETITNVLTSDTKADTANVHKLKIVS
ncbi:site-specific integrase [Agrobacterium vitis]|uniref:site-specific integrase n=1 Tax=Allorhizobium ampelinum TaxID=3025782 RepID=UPI001F180D6E|nr:site-specific integrase [Allorhizobium ampelinum]